MAIYAVGDVQGCYRTLERLLARLGFDRRSDRLWLVGDLVNRGPRSLEVLRWAREMGDRVTAVLGNHDLHLLGRAAGTRRAKPKDTLDSVLGARDRDSLLDWLRRRPLLHRDGDRVLVHAGLLPAWTVARAEALAREAEAWLREPKADALRALARDGPRSWREDLGEKDRMRLAVESFTRLRTCGPDGRICRSFTGAPEQAPDGCLPWFAVPGRSSRGVTVVCGHWAALGLRIEPGLVALDTGCVWGRELTAVRLDDGAVFQEPFADRV